MFNSNIQEISHHAK